MAQMETSKTRLYYVRMTDKFMSGWGACAGKTNVLVVVCDTWKQAEAIKLAAENRREMRRITIMREMPRNRPGVLYSVKPFSEFSGPWLDYYREPVAA
jgi:hypothetical protein